MNRFKKFTNAEINELYSGLVVYKNETTVGKSYAPIRKELEEELDKRKLNVDYRWKEGYYWYDKDLDD